MEQCCDLCRAFSTGGRTSRRGAIAASDRSAGGPRQPVQDCRGERPVDHSPCGEAITLRITAIKAKDHNRNGAVHGFSLLRAKDRSHVPGWDFELKPGLHEFALNAPAEPGEYVVVCTVICSADHEGMHMRFVVLP